MLNQYVEYICVWFLGAYTKDKKEDKKAFIKSLK